MTRKLVYFFVALAFLILAISSYFLFNPSSEENEASLQGGLSRETVLRKENSVFDGGGFLEFSESSEGSVIDQTQNASEEEKPAKPKSYLDGLSPEERAKLYEKMYERFKPLVEKFPNNTLIPRKLTEAEAQKRKEDEDHYYRIQGEILERRDVPKEEMTFYLNSKLKRSDDMLEILQYGLDNYKKMVSENSQSPNLEYEKMVNERLESITKSKEEVLSAKKGMDR
ncbi:hypothetical protein EHQ53_14900 [Leptospira langatensis]|uniref:Uncharacterized protein n=1 Tax=Leptospira langatensis TaxID=2484983 RepID=A0A5F1ZS48_9LEPT|nr:hypothetical protein [Leptospira langatensis]TGK01765.1 hypothetical protein EHO57_08140 [Leptospira langatensis]TGL39371.1 hypothetical protein EHQ53_14900 [Leptospira langatensis]